MMRAPEHAEATPSRLQLAALSVVLFSMASSASAWSIHSSLSNATYIEENRMFRVYLMPEEILDSMALPDHVCRIIDDQTFIKDITESTGTLGTLFRWNHKAPPEKGDFIVKLDCQKLSTTGGNDSASTPTGITSMPRAVRVARDVTETTEKSDPTDKGEVAAESTTAAATHSPPTEAPKQSSRTVAPPAAPLSGGLESGTSTPISTVSPPTQMPEKVESTTPTQSMPVETTSQPSPEPKITTTRTTTTTTTAKATVSPRASLEETTTSVESTTNSEIITGSIGNGSASGRQHSDGDEPLLATSTTDPERQFSLVITRVSTDFIHGQQLASLEEANNITGELGASSNRSLPCLVLPKEVRVVESQYVLLAVALNATTGELIRGGHMLKSCGLEDWRPGKDFLAEAAHVRILDAKLFHLQVLSICLAAAVIVFALSAVFLCTKWRLAVRGSRRETQDEFYIKTFYTKEHQYAANGDDFYGFPTIRRDSTFYRNPNNVNATPNSIGGSSFVNGAFQDGEDHQNLPAPPPELRTCIINDANFTEVPLHNIGSDSLRAHRGAHRHQSPPPPPLRTVSSGYMSGQSTPAVEYHNPHEVMNLPPIPKEDYSDSDSDSERQASLKTTDDNAGRAVERKGRFTVRTAL